MDVDSLILSADLSIMRGLQWSHVLMDVDSLTICNFVGKVLSASMEPRPDGRG